MFPTVVLAAYIFAPSFRASAAIVAFYQFELINISELSDQMATKRQLQQFFSRYRIIIDRDDIIFVDSLKKENILSFAPVGCLEHSIIAYVPLKIRWPIYGTQTFEWCLVLKD